MKSSIRGERLLKSPQETTIAGEGDYLELDLEIMIPSRNEIILIILFII